MMDSSYRWVLQMVETRAELTKKATGKALSLDSSYRWVFAKAEMMAELTNWASLKASSLELLTN